MYTEKYTKLLPKEFPLDVSRGKGLLYDSRHLHRHDFLEINLVCGGEGIYIIGDKKYELKVGEIYIMNSDEDHHAFSNGSLDLLVVIFEPSLIWSNYAFDYEYLKPFFDRRPYFFNRIKADSETAFEVGLSMKEIEKEYIGAKEGSRLVIKALLLKILSLLYRHMKTCGQMDSDCMFEERKDYERIKDAVAFIHMNYCGELDFEKVARIAYMSIPNFSAYFKRTMKMTLTEYITLLRVSHAARLLKQTSENITEICFDSGFKTIAYFDRIFKKYMGVSPRDYRKKIK